MKPSEITPEQFEFCKQSNYMVDKEPKKKSVSVLEYVKSMPQLPQVQFSTTEQIEILRMAANKLGLYDAADYLKR